MWMNNQTRILSLLWFVHFFVYCRTEVYEDGPIALGGTEYSSRQEFYITGARSRTRERSPEELREVKRALAEFSSRRPISTLGSISVNVYFHVVISTSGEGAVSDSTIASQISVLNGAYASSNIQFTLAGTETTTSNDWVSCNAYSPNEAAMKAALRQGTYQDFNVYTTYQLDNTLGWTTYGGTVGSDYSGDGTVIDYRTMPGGNFVPYNLGYTLAHETGHWFGISHVFQGGCDPSLTGGDGIADTQRKRRLSLDVLQIPQIVAPAPQVHC